MKIATTSMAIPRARVPLPATAPGPAVTGAASPEGAFLENRAKSSPQLAQKLPFPDNFSPQDGQKRNADAGSMTPQLLQN